MFPAPAGSVSTQGRPLPSTSFCAIPGPPFDQAEGLSFLISAIRNVPSSLAFFLSSLPFFPQYPPFAVN